MFPLALEKSRLRTLREDGTPGGRAELREALTLPTVPLGYAKVDRLEVSRGQPIVWFILLEVGGAFYRHAAMPRK